jgi:hypothetical protein
MTKYFELDQRCGVPEFDDLDLQRAVSDGQLAAAAQRTKSVGQMRGGSVGAVIDNEIYGVCHRLAYLRFHGIEKPLPEEIELMTNQGEGNEILWEKDLQLGLPEHLYALNQEQFTCEWEIDGITGSGSPDIVIWDRRTDLPVRGLELKNISSASTMKSSHYELKPKTDHLIQAANYSIRMGDQYLGGKPLPYQLVYSSRSIHQVFAMSEKARKPVINNPVDVEFRYGKPMSVKPFHRIYNLHWDVDGTLRYWTPGMKNWVNTKLTRESIDKYYKAVTTLIDSKNELGPRPVTRHLDGSSSYSPCNYCDFSDVCNAKERQSTAEFRDHATQVATEMRRARGLKD